MKTQYKTTILAIVFLLISLFAAFLFTLYSMKFIEKWLDFINAIIIGVLSSAILLFFSSLINYNFLRRKNAETLINLVARFKSDLYYLYKIIQTNKEKDSQVVLSEELYREFESLLLSLKNTVYSLLTSEKVSPLALKTISLFKPIVSRFAKLESVFLDFCSLMSEKLDQMYHNVRDGRYEKADTSIKFVFKVSEDIDDFIRFYENDRQAYRIVDSYTMNLNRLLGINTKHRTDSVKRPS